MTPSPSRVGFVQTLAAVTASSILYYFSTGLHSIGSLIYVAPFPVLALAFRSRTRIALPAAFVAYALGALNMVPYLSRIAPAGIVVSSVVVPAAAFAVAVFFTRAAVLHGVPWLGVIVFPAAWTTYEFVLSLFSPHGTFGSIAYTQTGFLPLLQVVSLTGIWGVTFIVSIVSSGLAVAWHVGEKRSEAVAALALPTVILVVVLLFGSARLLLPETEWPLAVGLAVCDSTAKHYQTTSDSVAMPVVHAYARRAADLALEGALVVVLPEKFVGVTARYDTTVLRTFLETARENRVFIIAGLNDIEPLHNVNTAVVFSPLDNTLITQYDKRHLLPGFESRYRHGVSPRLFRIKQVDAGIEICKDMDFPTWSREYGNRRARIVFVPAWDFHEDEDLHARMAVVRGVENGFAVVRCAQEGLLTVSDDAGRIIAEESSASSPEVLLLSAVRPGRTGTLYTAGGDWFAWFNLVAFGFFIPSFVVYVSRRALLKFQSHS